MSPGPTETRPPERATRGGARTRTAAIVAATVVLAAVGVALVRPAGVGPDFWFWLAACAAGEALWVRLPLGGATLSMASCFNFAAVLVLTPGEAVVATAGATLVMELAVMRKPMVRTLFNSAQTALAVLAAATLFAWLAGGTREPVALLSQLRLHPFLAAALAWYAVNRALVVAVIASHERIGLGEAWRRNFGSGYEALSCGAVLSLGALMATHYAAIGMTGTVLVALPLALACDGLRRHTRRLERAAAEERGDREGRAA